MSSQKKKPLLKLIAEIDLEEKWSRKKEQKEQMSWGGDWGGPGERGAASWEEVWETKWVRPPIWSFRQKEAVWVFNLILVRSPWNFYKKLC